MDFFSCICAEFLEDTVEFSYYFASFPVSVFRGHGGEIAQEGI